MGLSYHILTKLGKMLTGTTDGDKVRLDVSSKIEGGANIFASLARYHPKFLELSTVQDITAGSEYTILDFDGDGQFDFIAINVEGVNWEFIVEVDGEEVYRINKNNLKTKHLLDKTEEFVHVEERYVDSYPTPVDFTANLTVKVKNVESSATKELRSALVRYREKIT